MTEKLTNDIKKPKPRKSKSKKPPKNVNTHKKEEFTITNVPNLFINATTKLANLAHEIENKIVKSLTNLKTKLHQSNGITPSISKKATQMENEFTNYIPTIPAQTDDDYLTQRKQYKGYTADQKKYYSNIVLPQEKWMNAINATEQAQAYHESRFDSNAEGDTSTRFTGVKLAMGRHQLHVDATVDAMTNKSDYPMPKKLPKNWADINNELIKMPEKKRLDIKNHPELDIYKKIQMALKDTEFNKLARNKFMWLKMKQAKGNLSGALAAYNQGNLTKWRENGKESVAKYSENILSHSPFAIDAKPQNPKVKSNTTNIPKSIVNNNQERNSVSTNNPVNIPPSVPNTGIPIMPLNSAELSTNANNLGQNTATNVQISVANISLPDVTNAKGFSQGLTDYSASAYQKGYLA